jgi:hypothetical protein
MIVVIDIIIHDNLSLFPWLQKTKFILVIPTYTYVIVSTY